MWGLGFRVGVSGLGLRGRVEGIGLHSRALGVKPFGAFLVYKGGDYGGLTACLGFRF